MSGLVVLERWNNLAAPEQGINEGRIEENVTEKSME